MTDIVEVFGTFGLAEDADPLDAGEGEAASSTAGHRTRWAAIAQAADFHT